MIERLIEMVGRACAWLTALMGAVTTLIVVLRYGFDSGAIAIQESVIYMHALVVMLGISYTLKHSGHVRVDVLYARLSPRAQTGVDLAGHLLLLLPVSGAIFLYSIGYVGASWQILEGSPEVSGIPAVFLLKTLIPVMAVLLAAQGLVEIRRAISRLRAGDAGPPSTPPASSDVPL